MCHAFHPYVYLKGHEVYQHLLKLSTFTLAFVLLTATSFAQGFSVYIFNCSHPARGWQRSGMMGEVGVSRTQATQKRDARQRTGPAYEKYAVFAGTSQRVNSAAPNCGGIAPTPTCLFYAYIFNSRGGSGWLGGYRSSAEARTHAINFTRAYGGTWSGPTRHCF
jgi:hypothetical protein